MNNQMITQIPFSGFYETLWDYELDREEEQFLESLCGPEGEYKGRDVADIGNAIYFAASYRTMHQAIAKDYAERLALRLDAEAGQPLHMIFESMHSPREYNFDTDRLFMHIPLESVRFLRATAKEEELTKLAAEKFTDRSGFFSSYSPDVEAWGPLESWDHNQVGCLLEAWINGREDLEGIEDSIRENMSCNGAISTAFDAGLDMNTLRDQVTSDSAKA